MVRRPCQAVFSRTARCAAARWLGRASDLGAPASGSRRRGRGSRRLAGTGALGALPRPVPRSEQLARGYGHTLREIAQQPVTWIETAARMRGRLPLSSDARGRRVGRRAAPSSSRARAARSTPASAWPRACSTALGVPVSAVPAGLILTHPETCLPPHGPVPRGLARALGQQPREPRRRGLAAREPPAGPPPLHHLQPATAPSPRPTGTAPACGRSCSTRRRTTAAW